jgi:hypothetical protein
VKTADFILEVPARLWLREVCGASATLADVPERCAAEWASQGIGAVWLMGVWEPSEESRRIALKDAALREEYGRALPDWKDADVGGSPFAICGYDVSADLGGREGLAAFRERLARHGLRLLLDFIPNHTARDHPWVTAHPDWYVTGTEADVVSDPAGWFWVTGSNGPRAVAHGRDPNFPAWTDTAQLNYANSELQAAMQGELVRLTGICDGVRCDMAMLVLANVFERVWKRRCEEFWPEAIAKARRARPDFFFMAECYWGLEERLLEMGFDAVYDKALLDDVAAGRWPLRDRFDFPAVTQGTRVRFLENHDEPRAAARFDLPQHRAFAAWLLGLPSVRLLQEGQREGRKIRTPVQLTRRMKEQPDESVRKLYDLLLKALKTPIVREGHWQLLSTRSAWSGNESHHHILGQSYEHEGQMTCIFVNAADARSQCCVHLGLSSPAGGDVVLRDLLSDKVYVRDGIALMLRGLYLDMERWEAQIFECTTRPAAGEAQ